MHIVIVGAGAAGLFSAIALARRGHRITVIDRDPGPPVQGKWNRKGVMQFHHAHTFRGPVVETLRDELPDVLAHLTDVGAVIASAPDGRPAALLCRRSTFDAVLRSRALAERSVTVHTGHVSGLVIERGRVTGVRLHGETLDADLVLDASGRSSKFTEGLRAPAEGGECGIVYATRQYRWHDGAPPATTNAPIGLSLGFQQYFAIGFLHDDHTFSITFAHDGGDRRLRELRHAEVFESAVRAIPALGEWADPRRSRPTSRVLPGGRIYNGYRGQLDPGGRRAALGLISVGDAVCTTTPLAGRGITMALAQARTLSALIDDHGADIDSTTRQFDQWCTESIRPWFEDHCHADAERQRRWGGGDVDVTRRLPSDLIVAAAAHDSGLSAATDPYARMDALPDSLDPVEPIAREIYANGWRPALPDGPTRDELAEVCHRHALEVA